jgi:MFS superfamily sulfate permease-like transporter
LTEQDKLVYGVFALSFLLCGLSWIFLSCKTKLRKDKIAGIAVALFSVPTSFYFLYNLYSQNSHEYFFYALFIGIPIFLYLVIPPYWRYTCDRQVEMNKFR